MDLAPGYPCSNCGEQIEEGEFLAVVGKAPGSGLNTPVGRVDKLLDELGELYCQDCLSALTDAVNKKS